MTENPYLIPGWRSQRGDGSNFELPTASAVFWYDALKKHYGVADPYGIELNVFGDASTDDDIDRSSEEWYIFGCLAACNNAAWNEWQERHICEFKSHLHASDLRGEDRFKLKEIIDRNYATDIFVNVIHRKIYNRWHDALMIEKRLPRRGLSGDLRSAAYWATMAGGFTMGLNVNLQKHLGIKKDFVKGFFLNCRSTKNSEGLINAITNDCNVSPKFIPGGNPGIDLIDSYCYVIKRIVCNNDDKFMPPTFPQRLTVTFPTLNHLGIQCDSVMKILAAKSEISKISRAVN
jgi:hypothetical protein